MKSPRWRPSLVLPAVIAVFAAALVAGATDQAALASTQGPHVTAIPAQRAVLGEPTSLQVHATATGGTAWYLARHLPPGLSIGFWSGKISGRPRVTAGTWTTRVTVHTHQGSSSVSFRWRVASRPGEVTGYGAKCADVHAGDMRYGTKIDIWTCNFKPQQRITFWANGELVVNGWCVTGPGRVHLARCHGWRTQTWRRKANGEYILRSNGRCLTDPSSSKADGRQLVLARCTDAANQRWSLPKPQRAKTPPRITSPGAQRSTLGQPVSLQVHATAPAGVITYRASGLPYGLSISKSTGKITGTPDITAAAWRTTVTATAGERSASVSFRWRVASRPGELHSRDSNCLDDYGHAWYGSTIGNWACNGTPQQRVSFWANGELVVNGWCVTGPGRVHLARCHGWHTQTWRRRPNGEYVLRSNGRCLTDPSTSSGGGRLLSVARCAATTSQHWSLPEAQHKPSAVPPPTDETVSPGMAYQPGAPAAYGCGAASSDLPWAQQQEATSPYHLSVRITPATATGTVRAKYFMWDNGTPVANPAGTDGNGGAGDLSGSYAGTAVTSTELNFTLVDGHHYTWTAEAVTTNPDGTTEVSARAPVCGFQVDTTAPARPAVSSSDFPPSGSGKTGPPAGSSGTFTFSSTDPVPSCSGCRASGVYAFTYSLNAPVTNVNVQTTNIGCGASTSTSGIVKADSSGKATSCQVGVGQWGTNILYVEAIDKAGNVSASYDYYFNVPKG